MATYGKKKRSILPSFSTLRDSDVHNTGKDKIKKRGSSTAFSLSTIHHSTDGREPHYSRHDDSIDEMASILLDDTTEEQLKPEPGKRLSRVGIAQALPSIQRVDPSAAKSLPQLPKLLFNGDDAWAMKSSPVVTAAGSSNQMVFSSDTPESLNVSADSPQFKISRAPTIPRKSSKRKSARPRSALPRGKINVESQQTASRLALKSSISPPKPVEGPEIKASSTMNAADVNEKIVAMLAATKALKPTQDDALHPGTFVPTKKRRLMDNKMLTRMKSAINDRLQIRGSRRRDSIRDDKLLDRSLNELQDFEDPASASVTALSTVEIRMNEGDNFKNPKINALTGHGRVPRKPIADDGKSLRSRKSVEDPFSERPQSSGLTRTPSRFEARLKDDMSIDQSSDNFIPDVPELPPTVNKTPKRARSKKSKNRPHGGDLDALLSSSPLASSTPRLRLEPSFNEDGKKTLENVRANARSLFDPDDSIIGLSSEMDIDSGPSSKDIVRGDTVKRKNPKVKESLADDRLQHSKRIKKHPSPSKDELNNLEEAMRNLPPVSAPEDVVAQDNGFPNVAGLLRKMDTLAPKDANRSLRKAKRQVAVIGGLRKPALKQTVESMPDIPARLKATESTNPTENAKLKRRGSQQYASQNDLADASLMDIDELQWDNAAYYIGMRRD